MLADQFDVFLFDLDGVIYVQGKPLPGAVHAVNRLQNEGKEVYFLTNDPVPTRTDFVQRLQKMGIDVRIEQVISSGWTTAQYLHTQAMDCVYLLGSNGLRTELEQAGIKVGVRGDQHQDRGRENVRERGLGQIREHDLNKEECCQAVVVGWDEQVSFVDIQQATRLIFAGAAFVSTNADTSFPGAHGPLPATGAIVQAIQTVVGQSPTIVGKPYPLMFHMALQKMNAQHGGEESKRVVMVGDNPHTDILGAHRAGLPAILVIEKELETKKEASHTEHGQQQPEYVIANLTQLFRSE